MTPDESKAKFDIWSLKLHPSADRATAWEGWQAALRSQGKVEGWRPIETAPQDRTMLLLADKSGSVQIGFWNGSAWDDGDFHDNMGPMTHWMHMPSAPTNDLTAIIGEGD